MPLLAISPRYPLPGTPYAYTVTASRRDMRGAEHRPVPAPMLHLVGAWIAHAGFTVGLPVTVRVSERRLVIEAAGPEQVSQAEAFARIADGDLLKRDVDRFVAELRRGRRRRHRSSQGIQFAGSGSGTAGFPGASGLQKVPCTVQWYMPRPSA